MTRYDLHISPSFNYTVHGILRKDRSWDYQEDRAYISCSLIFWCKTGFKQRIHVFKIETKRKFYEAIFALKIKSKSSSEGALNSSYKVWSKCCIYNNGNSLLKKTVHEFIYLFTTLGHREVHMYRELTWRLCLYDLIVRAFLITASALMRPKILKWRHCLGAKDRGTHV